MSELVYLSQPSRLGGAGKESYRQQVIQSLLDRGFHVVHPFEALPYERFEGHPRVGRELAMQYCCDLIAACRGGMALTGISEGTLVEATYLRDNFPDRAITYHPELDPLWEQEMVRFSKEVRFATLLGEIPLFGS